MEIAPKQEARGQDEQLSPLHSSHQNVDGWSAVPPSSMSWDVTSASLRDPHRLTLESSPTCLCLSILSYKAGACPFQRAVMSIKWDAWEHSESSINRCSDDNIHDEDNCQGSHLHPVILEFLGQNKALRRVMVQSLPEWILRLDENSG